MRKKDVDKVKPGDRLYVQYPIQVGTGKYGRHIKLEPGHQIVFTGWSKDGVICKGKYSMNGTLFDEVECIVKIPRKALMTELDMIKKQL